MFSDLIIRLLTALPGAKIFNAYTTTAASSHDAENSVLSMGFDPLQGPVNQYAKQLQQICPGYKAVDVQHTVNGLSGKLLLAGPACNVYGTDIELLDFKFELQGADRLHVLIKPAFLDEKNASHYTTPEHLLPTPRQPSSESSETNDLYFSWTNDPTFEFSVRRRSTSNVLFDTTGSKLIYESQFVQFVSQLPRDYNLYGLGERIHGLRLNNNLTATMWAVDAGDPIDGNIYGSHPFYVETRYFAFDDETGTRTLLANQTVVPGVQYESWSHGVFNRNIHGMDVILQPTNITWRAIGGAIDLYFFAGPSPADVIRQYQAGLVGFPCMQQYFAFGFHQCRWGYESWDNIEDVIRRYREADIPLETIWNDLDYMDRKRNFENDPNKYPFNKGKDFLERLLGGGQHYVPLVDAAIYVPDPDDSLDGYATYSNGHEKDVFLKRPDGSEYVGRVWPGDTVFPDWHAQQAQSWWTDELKAFHDRIPFSGIWNDMNEPSDFSRPGMEREKQLSDAKTRQQISMQAILSQETDPTLASKARNVHHPPYAIHNVRGELAGHTIPMDTRYADGMIEYDLHNLYGHEVLNATYHALLQVAPGKRPFIISRGTAPGSGKMAGHWGGDNYSLFAYMYFSISQALAFSMFGIPMFGVDTCGFALNATEELCNRWQQLSAFMPFYRNHNVREAADQEAYIWPSVAEATRKAMAIRYSLLPYIYTLFYHAHTTGSTVLRALAWEFPSDPALAAIENQFLLGPSLMIVPVLGEGLRVAKGVFPDIAHGEIWYDWYTKEAVDARPGENVTIPAPLGHIPVFIRGGAILPQQEPLYTTRESRNSPWSLLCALSKKETAFGSVYVDDGESIEPDTSLLVDLTIANGSLSAMVHGSYRDHNALANVTIMGVRARPKTVQLDEVNVRGHWSYNETSRVLVIKDLKGLMRRGAWKRNWTLTWQY